MSNTQTVTLPAIQKIVKQAKGKTVTTDDIAAKLIGANVADIRGRAAEQGTNWQNVAINDVAWYSQRVTAGTNPFAEGLERTKVGGKYAYRWIG